MNYCSPLFSAELYPVHKAGDGARAVVAALLRLRLHNTALAPVWDNAAVLHYLDKMPSDRSLSEEEKKLYDRIISDQKEHAARVADTARENQDRLMRMYDKSMEAIADIAKSLGGRGQAASPPPAPQPAQPAALANVIVCPRCNRPSPLKTAFCPNCGNAFPLTT